ncbi:g11068 [Coccomyxa elongata]
MVCALATIAGSSILTGVNHTLGIGLHRATVVYTNAEAALAEGQLELEHSLKPPKDLQDALSKAKASLPPPPDPIQQVLGGFADAALSGLFQPATDAVQKAVKDNVDRGAADLTKDNAALATLVGQIEGLLGQQPPGGVCPESCLDLGKYPMLHSSACMCAHQALGHMHDLALHARYQGAVAIAGASMMVVGLVWLLGHLAFWLGGMHARQLIAQNLPSIEQLPLKNAPMAIARDDSDDSLILSEVEMAAATALDHNFRAGPPKETC